MSDDDRKVTVVRRSSHYVVAFAIALIAVALRIWLAPFLGGRIPYLTAWVAVAFCAWYYGLGPSLLATATSVLAPWFWIPISLRSRMPLDRTQLWGVLSFLLSSAVIIALGEAARRSKARINRTEQSLREGEARLNLVNRSMQREIKRRTMELERRTVQNIEQQKLLDLANDAILIREASGRISYWNQGAERLYGWTRQDAVGNSAHDILRTVFPVPLSQIVGTERWEGELIQVRRDGSVITVASRWATLRDRDGQCAGWLEINTDITDRKQLEEAARRLTGRILSLQDDERRRIARELHDSLGQYLVSVKVNLDLLARTLKEPQQNVLLSDCLSNVEHCLTETRTISHLLHPPLLDEAGFASAARWYIEGFAERSELQVDSDIPPRMGRLNRDVETALFRVLQEALTNVHRHSGGSRVKIVLRVDPTRVQLQIADDGRGIPPDRLRGLQGGTCATGVGLAGMRQRMRELGGSLHIESVRGTTITAAIPLSQTALSQTAVPPPVANRPQDAKGDISAA